MKNWSLTWIGQALIGPENSPFGRLAFAAAQRGAHCIKTEPKLFKSRGIDFNAYGRPRSAADEHLADSFNLRQLLRKNGVRCVINMRLASDRSEVSARIMIGASAGFTFRYAGLPGRLAGNWPRAALMAACTSRAAASMFRLRSNWSVMPVEPSWLVDVISVDACNAAELPFERRGHCRGHRLRTRARQICGHLDDGKFHLRQRRDRQQRESQTLQQAAAPRSEATCQLAA